MRAINLYRTSRGSDWFHSAADPGGGGDSEGGVEGGADNEGGVEGGADSEGGVEGGADSEGGV